MKKSTPEERANVHQKAIGESYEIYENYVTETVNGFVEENNIFDAIRALRRVRATAPPQSTKGTTLQTIDSIEFLLIDLAEARARLTELLCKSHVQQLA